MRLSWAVAVVLLAAMPPAPAMPQAVKLGDLFQSIDPAPPVEPGVDIVGWIERDGADSLVRISLNARNGARLVADPGIVVRPLRQRQGIWLGEAEVSHRLEGVSYFDSPPTIDVGLVREDGMPVELDVQYAYCLVDEICLFGEERIAVTTRAAN